MAVRSLFTALALLVFMCASNVTYGAPIQVSPGCDPEFLDVMEARAWMEGQREVEVAARIILKPDSVLEYSCFDNRIDQLGAAANLIFSDRVSGSPLFPAHGPTASNGVSLGADGPNPPGAVFTSASLDNALNQLVTSPTFTFAGTNFGHTFAGGTYAGIPPAAASCNAMNAVWSFLKCQDFNQDFFRTFQELSVSDPRTVPIPCNDAGRAGRWTNALATAYPPPATPAALGGLDIAVHYNRQMNAGSCSAATPVYTGVQVVIGGVSRPEAVCSIPGCYFDGAGGCN